MSFPYFYHINALNCFFFQTTSEAMQASAPIMMSRDDDSSSSEGEDDNNNVPKIVVENAVDEDREPDVRTESLLKVCFQFCETGKGDAV